MLPMHWVDIEVLSQYNLFMVNSVHLSIKIELKTEDKLIIEKV